MNVELQNDIVVLINQAQLAGAQQDATNALSQAFELIFRKWNQPSDDNSESSNNNNSNSKNATIIQDLLDEYLEKLLEFELSKFVQVKKLLIDFIGEICQSKPRYLLESLPVLSRLLDETEHPVLVKSSIICVNNLMRILLHFLNSEIEKHEEFVIQTIWEDFNSFKQKLLTKLDSTEQLNGAILHQILRFLESIVLAYSFPNSQPAETKNPPFNLFYVWKENQERPSSKRLLVVPELQHEAEETFKVLILQLSKQISSSTLVVVINIFSQIGKERYTFLKLILATLKQIQQGTLSTFTGSHISSIQHAIKNALMTFLKNKVPPDNLDEILNLFEILGIADQGQRMRQKFYPHLRRTSPAEPSDPRSLAKKFKEEQEEPQEEPIPTNISEAGQNLINLLLQLEFTPNMIADLVLENMKALPPAPPSNVALSLSADVSRDLIALLQVMSQSIEKAVTQKKKLAFNVELRPLEPKDRQEERNAAFLRILESEKELGVEGRSTMRIKVLSSLATRYDMADPICSQLVSHILQNFADRKELALAWIEAEYNTAVEGKQEIQNEEGQISSLGRYNSILLRFLKNLKAILEPNDRLLTYLVLHAPELTTAALEQLENYVSDEPFTKMALSTLHDIVLNRPKHAREALALLLGCTTRSEEFIREKAIRLVSNKLYLSTEEMTTHIEVFATRCFDQALHLSDDSDQDDYVRHILIYFVLCTKKLSMINKIFETFAVTNNQQLKKAILHQSVVLIRAIGQTPELCDIIANFPKKSEQLVLNILHVLTDKAPPSPNLVSVVKGIYTSVEDARFLISILPALSKDELIEYLPKLMSLPTNITKTVILKIITKSNALLPAEVMVQLHLLEKENIPLKAIMDATQVCFDEKSIFTPEILATALQRLMYEKPIPQLFMRTVIQAVTRYQALTDFVMDLLAMLLSKSIWNDQKLWEGFVMCCKLTLPNSLPVVAQIPAQHRESAWKLSPELREAFEQQQQQ